MQIDFLYLLVLKSRAIRIIASNPWEILKEKGMLDI